MSTPAVRARKARGSDAGQVQAYLVALGSNRPHPLHGGPDRVIGAAVAALREAGLAIVALSPTIRSTPIGPSRRRFANAALIAHTDLAPEAMLDLLQQTERTFGRCRRGQRWGARVLDLDIVLWSGGRFVSSRLVIPHPAFRTRAFVLGPAARIAPSWRDPATGLTLRQLNARLTRPRAASR